MVALDNHVDPLPTSILFRCKLSSSQISRQGHSCNSFTFFTPSTIFFSSFHFFHLCRFILSSPLELPELSRSGTNPCSKIEDRLELERENLFIFPVRRELNTFKNGGRRLNGEPVSNARRAWMLVPTTRPRVSKLRFSVTYFAISRWELWDGVQSH